MTIQRMLLAKRTLILSTDVAKFQSFRAASSSAYSFNNDDYQYLQRGQIPMLHFQRSLPRLPIPKLDQTCTRFLASVRPLIKDSAVYDDIFNLVQKFQTTGSGPELQRLLIAHDKANLETSYISLPWFDMYLSDRRPLPINYNPVLIMKPDTRPEYNNQLTKTANLVVTALRFMRSLREELLEPEVYHINPKKSDTDRFRFIMRNSPTAIATFVAYAFKAFPLDMSQVSVIDLSLWAHSRSLAHALNIRFYCSIKVCLVQLVFRKWEKIEFIVQPNRHTSASCEMVTFMR